MLTELEYEPHVVENGGVGNINIMIEPQKLDPAAVTSIVSTPGNTDVVRPAFSHVNTAEKPRARSSVDA